MSSGLLKFSNRITATNGDKLHWGRVDADGLPFRGPITPTYREDEWESRTVKVADARNGFFDVHDVVSNKQYLDVLECCANGWFQLVYLERFWTDPNGNRTSLHYVEWLEYYVEDGSRVPYQSQGIMELQHGQQNLISNFGTGQG